MSRFYPVCAGILLTSLASAQERTEATFTEVADRMVKAINGGDYEGLRKDFDPVMLKEFPVEKCRAFFQGVRDDYGKFRKLERPQFKSPAEAIFVARCERGALDFTLTLDPRGRVAGMLFRPHIDLPTPARNDTRLALPVRGKWFVVWGGDSEKLNAHFGDRAQRYAFDLTGVGADGKTHRRAGADNDDYYAFGREVLAPADGVVTEAIDGVRDNVPRSMNRLSALGNAVFIRHGDHEVSVLAHLKQGSTRVKAGDQVKKGQVVGLCGNSGNSSEPHLHFHLQNTPVIQDAAGSKCFFEEVQVEKEGGKTVLRDYSPIQGDIISPVR